MPPSVDLQNVRERCEELRDLVDLGPGSNAEILRKALGTVRALLAAAEWEFPRQILIDLKERLIAWFSDRLIRGDVAELRSALMQDLVRLCASWEAPNNEA